jgi:hypothetical protein
MATVGIAGWTARWLSPMDPSAETVPDVAK